MNLIQRFMYGRYGWDHLNVFLLALCLIFCILDTFLRGSVFYFLYVAVFAVARYCGKPLLSLLFSEKTIAKYSSWAEEKNRFAKMFALAIFFPVAPDDFLCYLAGTTGMSWRCYTAIILLGKPFAIALYSLGLTVVWRNYIALL